MVGGRRAAAPGRAREGGAEPGALLGARRDTQLFFDRIQRTDQFLLELYLRIGLARFDNSYAAGIFNITI